MTPEQYWEGDPHLVRYYYEAHKLRNEQKNQEFWLQGLYVYKAVETVVGNALRKKGAAPLKYIEKPIDLSPKEEIDAEKEREKAVASFEALRKAWELKHGHDRT